MRTAALLPPFSPVEAVSFQEAPPLVAHERGTYQCGTGSRAASACGAIAVVGGALAAAMLLAGVTASRPPEPPLLTVMDVHLMPPPPPAPVLPAASAAPPAKPTLAAPVPEVAPAEPVPAPVAAPAWIPSAPLPAAAVTPGPVSPPAPPAPPASPAPAGPLAKGELTAGLLSATPPAYPLDSRRRREQGTVRLALLVGPDGRVQDIAVAESSGHYRLDRAALSAVRRWRWSPVLRDGAAVAVRGYVLIPFVLTR